ncbi:MAG TPA: carboxymuconolactone decarboxylase family protein [Candidatus Elarobacter sp.]|jgi:alkylhydroperoxidase family enzyme
MQTIPLHTLETAPEKSKPSLEALVSAFGFIPNLVATMAESPTLTAAFVSIFGTFQGNGSFDDAEKQVLLLTNAVTLRCRWTTAFHATLALKAGVPSEDVALIRAGGLPNDERHAALSALTKVFIERRGFEADTAIARCVSAGYTQSHILDVIAGIGTSTMAATTGNLTDPPIEPMFEASQAARATGN